MQLLPATTTTALPCPSWHRQLGIDVTEKVSPKSAASGYTNLVTVTFETDAPAAEGGVRTVAGAVFENDEARLVQVRLAVGGWGWGRWASDVRLPPHPQVDDFRVDIAPRGEMIFFNNLDKPGVLKGVTGAWDKTLRNGRGS